MIIAFITGRVTCHIKIGSMLRDKIVCFNKNSDLRMNVIFLNLSDQKIKRNKCTWTINKINNFAIIECLLYSVCILMVLVGCSLIHFRKKKNILSSDTFPVLHHLPIQDHSQLFKLISFFEIDFERRCKMHKRRVDMLADMLDGLNRQHFLTICRQLMFELAETYR